MGDTSLSKSSPNAVCLHRVVNLVFKFAIASVEACAGTENEVLTSMLTSCLVTRHQCGVRIGRIAISLEIPGGPSNQLVPSLVARHVLVRRERSRSHGEQGFFFGHRRPWSLELLRVHSEYTTACCGSRSSIQERARVIYPVSTKSRTVRESPRRSDKRTRLAESAPAPRFVGDGLFFFGPCLVELASAWPALAFDLTWPSHKRSGRCHLPAERNGPSPPRAATLSRL